MSRKTETIAWHVPADEMPDADTTVLLHVPESEDDPVWPGFWDGEQWRYADAMPLSARGHEVAHWGSFPVGP